MSGSEAERLSTPHRWWRRNIVGLLAVLVLLPATIAITVSSAWGEYLAISPSDAVTVEVAEEADYGKATWRLDDLLSGTSEDVDSIPDGTTLVVARIAVDFASGDAPPGCFVALTERGGAAGDRRWRPADRDEVDLPLSEGYVGSCSSEATEPYILEIPFLVPTEELGELAVTVEVSGLTPTYLRLLLPSLS